MHLNTLSSTQLIHTTPVHSSEAHMRADKGLGSVQTNQSLICEDRTGVPQPQEKGNWEDVTILYSSIAAVVSL